MLRLVEGMPYVTTLVHAVYRQTVRILQSGAVPAECGKNSTVTAMKDSWWCTAINDANTGTQTTAVQYSTYNRCCGSGKIPDPDPLSTKRSM